MNVFPRSGPRAFSRSHTSREYWLETNVAEGMTNCTTKVKHSYAE